MKRDVVLLLLRKEIRSASRNRSLILLVLLVPLVVFPVLIFIPPILANPAIETSPVLVVNLDTGSQGANLTQQISDTTGLSATIGSPGSDPRHAVESGLYDAALVIPANFTSSLDENRTAMVQVYYDASYGRSMIAHELLSGAMLTFSQQILIQRNQSDEYATPVAASDTSLRSVRPLIATVASVLPLLWTFWAILVGAYLGMDMTSSESDEANLPALLASPHTSSEIVSGKILAALLFGIFSALLAVFGIYIIPTLGVLIGSGWRSSLVTSSIPLTGGIVGVIALTVASSFFITALLFNFSTLFLTGADRFKLLLSGLATAVVTTVFMMSTSELNLRDLRGLIPLYGAYTLSSRAVAGSATLSDAVLVGVIGTGLALLLMLLLRHEIASEGLLRRSVFAPVEEPAEEEQKPAGAENNELRTS